MLALADLTGRFAAHAVWCISDPETFIPLIGHEKDGKRGLLRLAGSTLEDSVDSGKSWLVANPQGVDRAVLIFDGFLTLNDSGKIDALIIDAVEYGEHPIRLRIGVRYRPGGTNAGFKVGSPKVLENDGLTEADWEAFFARFWQGVKSHNDAAVVWANHLDDEL